MAVGIQMIKKMSGRPGANVLIPTLAMIFCLEKYHIIECGYSIKCNPRVPEELMQFVNTDNHTITTPFKGCIEYTNVVISAMRTVSQHD